MTFRRMRDACSTRASKLAVCVHCLANAIHFTMYLICQLGSWRLKNDSPAHARMRMHGRITAARRSTGSEMQASY